jgi:uncharacterized protein YbjT (DUF2867 family)
MYVVMGATGHVGSEVMNTLLAADQPVTAISSKASKRDSLERRGVRVAIADVHDVETLRAAFNRGKHVFVLNPPADPSVDAASEEKRTVDCIVRALHGSTVEKVVAESTFGAQPGDQLGDLGVLYDLELKLAASDVKASVIRAAYYMSNWETSLGPASKDGVVPTFYPVDMQLPMVAPEDLGRVAARLLAAPAAEEQCVYVEGPRRYSSADVADAFSAALDRPVIAKEIPFSEWKQTMQNLGFSEKSAESFANMTRITREGGFPDFDATLHGRTTLQDYIAALVKRSRGHYH